MRTRSQGLPLIEFDPDINTTCRNLRKQKQEVLDRMATKEQLQALQEQIKQLKDAQTALEAQRQRQRQFQPGGRPHPYLSYSNPNNALQPPPGFSVSSGGVINEPKKDSLEEMMKQVLVKVTGMEAVMETKISNMEHTFSALSKQVQMLENQVGQMANQADAQHKPGQFLSNTTVNPKGQCIAMFDDVLSPEDDEVIDIFLASCEETGTEHESSVEEPYKAPVPLREYIPKVPFPHSLGKMAFEELCVRKLGKKVDDKGAEFEVLHGKKEIAVVYTEKGGNEKEKILPAKDSCTELLMKLLPKKKDPGSFTIACVIGWLTFSEVLWDSDVCLLLMPLFAFHRVGIG